MKKVLQPAKTETGILLPEKSTKVKKTIFVVVLVRFDDLLILAGEFMIIFRCDF